MSDKEYAIIKIWHAIKRIVITLAMLGVVTFLIAVAPDYVKDTQTASTKLIINNSAVTNIKSDIIIKDDEIYLSMDDVKNFFDEYITTDDTKIITTSNTKTVSMPKPVATMQNSNITSEVNSNKSWTTQIYENGSIANIKNGAIYTNNTYYLPMTSLANIYNYEIKYVDSTNSVIINSLNRKLVQATCSKNLKVKYKATIFSKAVDKVKRGDVVNVVQDAKTNTDFQINEWVKVVTNKGKIGYLKKADLIDEKDIRENLDENKINGKVSLVWDYYGSSSSAPTRNEKIDGINVVSPSFFEVKSDGTLNVNIGTSGKDYITWAHDNKYDVWPTVSNSSLNNLDAISKMLSTFETRSTLIDSIINNLIDAGVDGINIDFENMYKTDKENYSRFIIELAPRLQEIGMKMCVDVTAPDGSDTWSLCYDRNIIGKVTDYLVFIAYDQHGVTNATSIAGADWIEINIKKFLGQEGVDSSKLILAMPFYTRLWKEQNGKTTSQVVNMKNITIPSGVSKTWDNATKQYYFEYTLSGAKYKMWIEDDESISAKLDLVNRYNLSGAGFWEKDRETSDVWSIIKQKLSL